MKKNLKLNKLAQNAMKEKEMSHINGGVRWVDGICYQCGCGCNGPSSTNANGLANMDGGLFSPGGGWKFSVVCD
ncbi:MAG: TIGR04149 family rSAM-modified RiPP [Bacteroidales bacterium]|jgi:natural product precursor|nr:TIGR04149 family rSAM-modified RiPP [Bacteroidales bacterium]